jgi:hypothetical protein
VSLDRFDAKKEKQSEQQARLDENAVFLVSNNPFVKRLKRCHPEMGDTLLC